MPSEAELLNAFGLHFIREVHDLGLKFSEQFLESFTLDNPEWSFTKEIDGLPPETKALMHKHTQAVLEITLQRFLSLLEDEYQLVQIDGQRALNISALTDSLALAYKSKDGWISSYSEMANEREIASTSSTISSDDLLKQFGKPLVHEVYDHSLDQCGGLLKKSGLDEIKSDAVFALNKKVVELTLFNFFNMLEYNSCMNDMQLRIYDGQKFHRLTEISDGLGGDLIDENVGWIAEFSHVINLENCIGFAIHEASPAKVTTSAFIPILDQLGKALIEEVYDQTLDTSSPLFQDKLDPEVLTQLQQDSRVSIQQLIIKTTLSNLFNFLQSQSSIGNLEFSLIKGGKLYNIAEITHGIDGDLFNGDGGWIDRFSRFSRQDETSNIVPFT
ncbi:hypothetical protein [Pseudovibrio sp. SCP19]|uniref:hypothetical protein n=1 Tax=Pseudovibrio sp. SCP19 TaxID=3141374 RepID=UPI003338F39B